jgi:hypothetical protein
MTNQARLVALLASVATAAGCTANAPGSNDFSPSVAQCSVAAAWAPGVAYKTGDLVTFEGSTYQCIQGHTSQSDWSPSVVPALWGLTDCAGGGGGGGGGGTTPPDAGTTPPPDAPTTPPPDAPSNPGGGGTGTAPASLVFSAYKDTGISMNWNTNVISTTVSGSAQTLVGDLTANGGKTITLAFATGECGSENWGGVPGAALAQANAAALDAAGIKYILSTGGAAGVFTCSTDAGFESFLSRWSTAGLIGVDFDIEGGQSQQILNDLIHRVQTAHAKHPGLRFSLTLATLANNNGATTAQSLGSGVAAGLNSLGTNTLSAVTSILGFHGTAASWPSFVTVNLMTMDFGATSPGNCVVNAGVCDMGQSAIQAAFNLRDKFGVPLSNIELTPMIGGNDTQSEHVTLHDVDTMTAFAIANKLAGVHYWSYDRDTDCPPGSASATCNTLGGVGAHGFLRRFVGDGLH